MPTPDVIDYVKQQLKAGRNPEDIRRALLLQGWPENDVSDAIVFARSSIVPPKESVKKEKVPEKAGVALAGFIISLLAGLYVINESLPDFVSGMLQGITGSITPMLQGMMDLSILSTLLGAVILVSSFLILKYGKVGGIVVLALSVVVFLFTSSLMILLLGIIGGAMALMNK